MHSCDLFRKISLPALVSLLVFSAAGFLLPLRSEAAGSRLPYSLRERAMEAEKQMRSHRGVLNIKARASGIAPSAAQARPGIRINRAEQTASTIFFYDDMESGVNGWTTEVYSGADLWHQTSIDALSPAHSWWAGIEAQSNYDNGARVNTAVKSPPIDLTSAIAPVRLLFTENFSTERGWDYCMVDVTTDGGVSWTHLRGGYGSAPSGDTEGWQITDLDLSPYVGHQIQIRFYFDTGDEKFNAFAGWFVDDVVVFDQAGTVAGRKFFDVNNNSQKDIGERGIKNWTITATGPITLTTRTNYRGHYALPLPLGNYTISETFRPNWTQTYPLSGTWNVSLTTPDTLVDSIHFGNYIHASFINGRKFHDLNQNGVFDGADTALPEWKIVLADTNGIEVDFDRTDSLGEYQLYVFTPGRYIVAEVPKKGWIETAPAGEYYTVDIPDLSTNITGLDFGNFYSPLTNAILGMKFNDRNRNHQLDDGEGGVSGVKIQLMKMGVSGKFVNYRLHTTDSSGFYQFLSLPADTYRVVEVPQEGWWQSYPDSSHTLILNSGGTLDSVDFGNYEIAPGSIGGMKYNDLDGNGAMDPGESGLSGWRIVLEGTTYFGLSASQSALTDANGNYTLAGIWPGKYNISEVWRTNWRQTQPANLSPYNLTLGVEENLPGINFGNTVDSNFTGSFRSFVPESLALGIDKKLKHKPLPVKPDKVEFCYSFRNDGSRDAKALIVHFSVPVVPGTLTFDRPGTLDPTTKPKNQRLTLSPFLAVGDSVTLHGYGSKPVLQRVTLWRWVYANDSLGAKSLRRDSCLDVIRWPMPNSINLLQAVGGGIRVGLGGPHSVVHRTYTDVLKSLVERNDRMHIGDPRCLGTYSGTTKPSIKKVQRYLTPTKHNNKLFAEAIALQENIAASDLGISPGGFGNLVYDDGGGNQFNGFSLREIAGKLDSAMSAFNETTKVCRYPDDWYDSAFTALRRIDSAFCGVIDTESFSSGLVLKAVRPLTDVPYLRLDPGAALRNGIPKFRRSAALPEVFALEQNYPNPFNPTTTIEFTLPEQSLVTLKVYNMLGQEVATLYDHVLMDGGSQDAGFDAGNLASGVYFYRIVAEATDDDGLATGQKYVSVKKMIVLR